MAVRYSFRHRDDGDDGDLDIDDILEVLADEAMADGDIEAAMERLLNEGFISANGERVEGLQELLERTRQRRQEVEQRGDPSGAFERYAQWLDQVEQTESEALDSLLAEAAESGDERREEVTRELVDDKNLQRDLWGDQLAQRLDAAASYEFVSSEAAQEFERLTNELREDLLANYFDNAKEMLSNPDAEQQQRVRDMMNALSLMLEQRRRGEELDPSFEMFMAAYGDMFPEAESLDDIVAMLAQRAAAAEAMFRSLSAEQQSELRSLMSSMLSDMDLDLALTRLTANLRQATPELDWSQSPRFRGPGRGRFSDATSDAAELAQLRSLEEFLGRARATQSLPEVDIDQVRRHLGDDAARHVARLRRAMEGLSERGFTSRQSGEMRLTPAGSRRVGQMALRDLFSQLSSSPSFGQHRSATRARGGDREETARPFELGEPFNLHLSQTLRNALARQGPSTPLRLIADDFAVEEYEATRRSATVFAIDLSRSMALRANLAPAKKMLLALTQLIRQRFPRDFVAVVGFSALAWELPVEDIVTLNIDDSYGTNLQHALALSRHLLREERGQRQIVVVTDGEPTAHLDDSGEPFFSWPPVYETLTRTMAEVVRCTRAAITINTFALDIERSQFPFVEQIARVNGGRTFYTSVDDLGAYVLDDFVAHRSQRRAG